MAEILFPKELDEANEGNSVGGSRVQGVEEKAVLSGQLSRRGN